MLTVTLFRHAKAALAEPGVADFDRPLTKRGRKDATAMGAYFAGESLWPDLILCSPSERTRQTLAEAFAGNAEPPVLFEDALYHAEAPALATRLRKVDADKRHVMIIGHNPGMQALALMLTGAGKGEARAAVARKFPTAAVTVISFEVNSWRAIRASAGHLQRFITPKQLRGKE